METNWVESVGLVKPYQEVYGISRSGKTELVKAELRELHEVFSNVPIEGYGTKLSQEGYEDFPFIHWHDSIKAQTMLSHRNSIVLLEDLHEIVTKSNVRTLRRIINGHSRKMGCFVIEVIQSRDFAGYRLPPISFKIDFDQPYKFMIQFRTRSVFREEGPYDVSGFSFDRGVEAIIKCLTDGNRPVEATKRKIGESSGRETYMAKCCVEFDKGKNPSQVAKEFNVAPGSREYHNIASYFVVYSRRKRRLEITAGGVSS